MLRLLTYLMFSMLLPSILLCHLMSSAASKELQYPPCAYAQLDSNGAPDIARAMYNCSANILNTFLIPSYYPESQPVNVSVQIVLNNLISIDEVEGVAKLDLYFRLTWRDERWNIANLWENVKVPMIQQGIDFRNFFVNPQSELPLWTPDLMFQDAIDFQVIAETIKLQRNETFYWSRHCVLTIAQPGWRFDNYPMDRLSILVRFYSYAFPDDFLRIVLNKRPVLYVYESSTIFSESQKTIEGGPLVNFESNPVWKHKMNDYSAATDDADNSVKFFGKDVKRFVQYQLINILCHYSAYYAIKLTF